MHWTALLAYRRYPEDAMVADDLFCLGCGYNLRSLRVRGACPECGRAVEDSLMLLTQPARVAGALATIGKSYLGLLAVVLLIAAAQWGSGMLVWITFIVLSTCVLLRCVGALELRFLAGLQHRPQVTGRVNLLWWAIVIEFLATMAMLGVWAFSITGVFEEVSAIWAIAALVSIIAAGRSGIGLAQLLEYDSIVWELRVQQALVALALIAGLLGVLGRMTVMSLPAGNPTGMEALVGLVFVGAGLAGIAAIFTTFTGLLRLSIAAHSETEPMDHLVSIGPAHTPRPLPPPPPPRPREDSEVPLEPGRPTPQPRADGVRR